MAHENTRDEFLQNIRRALGRSSEPSTFVADEAGTFSRDARFIEERAQSVKREAEVNADTLMSQLQDSATESGWKVVRATSIQEAAWYITELARVMEARSILRSKHEVSDRLDLERALLGVGVELNVMAIEEEVDETRRAEQRLEMRERATASDIGVTGVDYAVAETGSCVLLTRKGVSRLISLLPPVHVAMVQRGQVLPSLDELFTLCRQESLRGGLGSYMNIITGPSRSADIEYTLVTGVHGPGEVHMMLIG